MYRCSHCRVERRGDCQPPWLAGTKGVTGRKGVRYRCFIGCQKAFAETIRQKEGDYLLCVKRNQEGLEAAVGQVFDRAGEADYVGVKHDGHEQVSPRKTHGRHEERSTTVIYDPVGLPPERPDLAAVDLVGRGTFGSPR